MCAYALIQRYKKQNTQDTIYTRTIGQLNNMVKVQIEVVETWKQEQAKEGTDENTMLDDTQVLVSIFKVQKWLNNTKKVQIKE